MKVCKNPVKLNTEAYYAALQKGDRAGWEKVENDYRSETHRKLISEGYTGPRTGGLIRIPHADSHAEYLFADTGRSGVLVLLEIGDAWNSPLAAKLTRAEVIKLIDRENKLRKIFGER